MQSATGFAWPVEDNCLSAPYEAALSAEQVAIHDLAHGLQIALEGFPSLLDTLDEQAPVICLVDTLLMEKSFLTSTTIASIWP